MSKFNNTYELREQSFAQDLNFYFVSKGRKRIVKAIQYTYVETVNGIKIYNLGFGDYDTVRDAIIDDGISNNGDVYKVFNTVLKTIPIFFAKYHDCILMVQGSDGMSAFIDYCKATCTKKCTDSCRNYNRRIQVYRHYIDRNFPSLSIDYHFIGGLIAQNGKVITEPYHCGGGYNVIYLYKKHNFGYEKE
jgi:hypothetical protein